MIQVYRLPAKLTNGFCFNGGNPIEFLNVDWFDTPDGMEIDQDMVRAEIICKNYYDPRWRFLVLDDREGQSFVIEAMK